MSNLQIIEELCKVVAQQAELIRSLHSALEEMSEVSDAVLNKEAELEQLYQKLDCSD